MIGILGGTFDPIHCGHLHIAQSLYEQLQLKEVRFIPCKSPLLGKKVIANEIQRLAMLRLALEPYTYFSIDKREIKRETPSYTIETLISLRHEFPQVPLALILGSDNLTHLNRWHQWGSLIEYAHLIIVPRAKLHFESYNERIQAFIKAVQIKDPALLSQQPAGCLLMAPVKPLAISATAIREKLCAGIQPTNLLPSSVLDYILKQKLYL